MVSRYTKETWKWAMLVSGFLLTIVGLMGVIYYNLPAYIYYWDFLTALGIIFVIAYAWLQYPR